jgi:predicted ATPase/DNA-binding SARP family transcriptional activator
MTSATSGTLESRALHERSSTRLALFGVPAVASERQSTAIPFERRGQLVAYLAVKRGWVGRAELASLLWPDLAARLAYTNLRKTLFRLQGAAWSPLIESEGGALRLAVDTDVDLFEQALAARRLADAIALRTGELLTGFDDDANEAWSSWLSFERERLRVAWRGAALARLQEDIEAAEGIDLSGRLLAADPLDEAALRAHLASLARDGQAARARQVYREFSTRLSRELGLAPSADLVSFRDGLSVSAPTPAPASPVPDPEFVGRTVELRRIRELMSGGECRLLTLVGPGGVGKTRLASRVQRDLAGAVADGCAFVSLEGAQSPADLASRLAAELGVREASRRDVVEDIEALLRERALLLVLDNFEDLVPHAPVVERLLAAAPGLRVVVTSRVRLATASEWLLPIEGLPCPEAEDSDHLEAFDAVRLFVQAARRVEPALVPSIEAEAIVDICRQLAGLPLALLLAAAWTRVLSCDAIAMELRRGTDLLQAADATMPARHASMEVVFEQSWRLLAPLEREALVRLSVFRGGATLAATRAVTGASLPVLAALADKSLLRKEHDRFSLHPLVQQLAATRLPERDGTGAAGAHAAYYLRFLAQAKAGIELGTREALRQVDADFENCRAAWHEAVGRSDTRGLLAAAGALMSFCDHRGLHATALDLLDAALAVRPIADDAHLGILLLSLAAHAQYRLDRFTEAQATARRALADPRIAHDARRRGKCVGTIAACHLQLGKYDEARRHFEAARDIAGKANDAQGLAAAYDHLSLVAKATGDFDEALRLSLLSLAEHRRLGDHAGEALCLNNLAVLQTQRGDVEAELPHLTEALAICDRNGLDHPRAYVLSNLADFAHKAGDYRAAMDYTRRALALAEASGTRVIACLARFNLIVLAVLSGEPATVHADLASNMRTAIALRTPNVLLAGMYAFAEILHAGGDHHGARVLLEFGAAHPRASAGYRAEFRQRLAQWPSLPTRAWPGMSLEELAERIATEGEVAHAPLIAALQGQAGPGATV